MPKSHGGQTLMWIGMIVAAVVIGGLVLHFMVPEIGSYLTTQLARPATTLQSDEVVVKALLHKFHHPNVFDAEGRLLPIFCVDHGTKGGQREQPYCEQPYGAAIERTVLFFLPNVRSAGYIGEPTVSLAACAKPPRVFLPLLPNTTTRVCGEYGARASVRNIGLLFKRNAPGRVPVYACDAEAASTGERLRHLTTLVIGCARGYTFYRDTLHKLVILGFALEARPELETPLPTASPIPSITP